MFNPDHCVLLVIDIQGKLASVMHEKEQLFKNAAIMIEAAHILGIPILWTEQVPAKVGETVSEIVRFLPNIQPIEKESFSCYPNKRFREALSALNRKQILVTGIETHVCVYQTVADLLDDEYEVQIIGDAVSSRAKENKGIGLTRMQVLGANITSTEMILCELIKTSEHKNFKSILNLIK